MVNTVVENAGLANPDIRARTDAHYTAMLDAFGSALSNAKRRGEVTKGFDVKPAAEYLLASAMGIQVFVRSRGSVSSASALGQVAVDVVCAWQRDAQNKT